MMTFLSKEGYSDTCANDLCFQCQLTTCICSCHIFNRTSYKHPETLILIDELFKEAYSFDIDELRALYKILEHQYISYENEEAHNVINKISKIVHESKKLAR